MSNAKVMQKLMQKFTLEYLAIVSQVYSNIAVIKFSQVKPSNIAQSFAKPSFSGRNVKKELSCLLKSYIHTYTSLSIPEKEVFSGKIRGKVFKFLPLPHGIKFPTPVTTIDVKFPSPRVHQQVKYSFGGGGCWCFYLIDTLGRSNP